MHTPFQIHFPPELCGNLKVSNETPAGCEYKIPFAAPSLIKCDLGDFLTQSVNGDGYWIELWSFIVNEYGYLDIEIKQPYISIAMFLKGNLEGKLLGNGMVTSRAKTYNIFYLPVGIQKMHLPKGEYVLLLIIPPTNYLKSLAKEHSSIRDILNRLLFEEEEGALLAFFPLPHGAWRIIKRLEKTKTIGAALDLDLRQYILEILGFYNEQYMRKESPPPSYLTTKKKAIAIREHILQNLGDIHLGGLNELALQFHITTKPLTKEFKNLTGKTIPKFITDERLGRATQLLANKEMTVFEIAEMVGFSDAANFIRKFKKKYGYSPRRRKDNLGKDSN